jgi:hypothetical protein
VSDLANGFWDELEQRWLELEERPGRSKEDGQEPSDSEEPWAKTSSADAGSDMGD